MKRAVNSAAMPTIPDHVRDVVLEVTGRLKDTPGALLPVLHGVQAALGHVPEDAVPLIAREMNLSRADVHGVISFYHFFRQQPAGRHVMLSVPRGIVPGHGRRDAGATYQATAAGGLP